MHSAILLLLVGAVSIQAVSYQVLLEEQWRNFKLEHGKFYQNEEEELLRQNIFMANLHKISEHNALYEMGIKSYKMSMNHFGDLTADEFLSFYTVEMPELYGQNLNSSEYFDVEDPFNDDSGEFSDYDTEEVEMVGEIDWTKKGAVTPVKNQGKCGSCWSFSATGALEAQWFKKTRRLISLSEQNLVDCSWRYGNHGCNGGWMHWAFNYIKANGGIDTEQSYPYQGHNGACHYNRATSGANVRGVVMVRGERDLQNKVASVGPVSVAVEVGHRFQFYHSGVYNEPACGHKLNHAMLAVGFGREGNSDYWLVKNSWGGGWGDRGYIKMSRNRNNQCGIADYPSYPLV